MALLLSHPTHQNLNKNAIFKSIYKNKKNLKKRSHLYTKMSIQKIITYIVKFVVVFEKF